ncbi:hypothetical protein [Natronoglycomyces albus]|uniref:Uncharacterized protein n=1 Tax=Natronoglycomyces albus TaxID=2811108 RepID=A0A895XSD1_9ACTN|nr:hypothetical protein [Natronoglycomyces albus]QSB05170.1 hypothetical protein JQS30_15660 [Natronoglycomyces albus]
MSTFSKPNLPGRSDWGLENFNVVHSALKTALIDATVIHTLNEISENRQYLPDGVDWVSRLGLPYALRGQYAVYLDHTFRHVFRDEAIGIIADATGAAEEVFAEYDLWRTFSNVDLSSVTEFADSALEVVREFAGHFTGLGDASSSTSGGSNDIQSIRSTLGPDNWQEAVASVYRERFIDQLEPTAARHAFVASSISETAAAYQAAIRSTQLSIYQLMHSLIDSLYQSVGVTQIDFTDTLKVVTDFMKVGKGSISRADSIIDSMAAAQNFSIGSYSITVTEGNPLDLYADAAAQLGDYISQTLSELESLNSNMKDMLAELTSMRASEISFIQASDVFLWARVLS